MALKISTMSFTTIWLESKTVKSFLLLTFVVLLFAACRREESNLDLTSKGQDYQAGAYYTDTITVKSSTVYVSDSIVSSTSVLVCGAYHDPVFGNVYNKSFTQIRLINENVDYTGAVVNAVKLRLDYYYGYGDTLQDQIFDVFVLPAPLGVGGTFYTISPEPDLTGLTSIGTATFQARPNTPLSFIDITLDNTYGQQLLDAANTSNNNFINTINGLAIVPRDQDKGSIIRINLSNVFSTAGGNQTSLQVDYTKNAQTKIAYFSIDGNCTRYYTAGFDRAGTAISGLNTSYAELSSASAGGSLYMQSMTGLKLKVSFPYIKDFLVQKGGNVLVNKAYLYIPVSNTSNLIYKEPLAIVMSMTDEFGQILKSSGQIRYVQNESSSAVGTLNNQIVPFYTSKSSYVGLLNSYFLANQLHQLPFGRALFVSPFYNALEVNRAVINAADIKLKVYYTIIK